VKRRAVIERLASSIAVDPAAARPSAGARAPVGATRRGGGHRHQLGALVKQVPSLACANA
jgi:hypothetical protein